MSELRPGVETLGRGFAVTRRGAAGRARSGAGATRITVTTFGACAAAEVCAGSGTASDMITFGKAIAAAPPSTASATVSARINISLMELPLPAENTYTGLIGSDSGN